MNKKNPGKVIAEKIFLLDCKVFKSNVTTTDEFLNNPGKPSGINFGFAQRTGFDFENKHVRIGIHILLQGMKSENEQLGIKAEYGFDFLFEVENLDDFILDENGKDKKVSGALGVTLISIAYSTARGMVLERTYGTYLDGIIIPIINPSELMKDDIKKSTN